jgi:hypothetical protein
MIAYKNDIISAKYLSLRLSNKDLPMNIRALERFHILTILTFSKQQIIISLYLNLRLQVV